MTSLPKYDIGEFSTVTLGKKLGAGSFGSVYVGLLNNGRFVAVKQIELSSDMDDGVLNKEVDVHRRLQHPNIIRYLHSSTDRSTNPSKLNIYLEFVTGGSLSSIMKTFPNGRVPVNPAKVYARHMFLGLEYLHSNGVAHRDIKGDNILVSQDTGTAKLADFDQAKVVQGTMRSGATSGAKTLAGTPYWMAPEVITEEAGYNPFKADVWSAGCTVAEMLIGRAPWVPMQNPMGVMYKLANTKGWPDAIPRDVKELGGCPHVIDFLDKCFERNPVLRPECTVMLAHPFLKV
eukprot:Tbor_TRINITY_DN6098_c0_g1::TRINITY_DN6098_c0_g1_i1::g.10394::m.10394